MRVGVALTEIGELHQCRARRSSFRTQLGDEFASL
jgi:hypothetical protein